LIIANTARIQPRRTRLARSNPKNTLSSSGTKIMSKEQRSNKESKKKPAMTMKEKKAAKKSKKESKAFLADSKIH
jgi:hypothetical protein